MLRESKTKAVAHFTTFNARDGLVAFAPWLLLLLHFNLRRLSALRAGARQFHGCRRERVTKQRITKTVSTVALSTKKPAFAPLDVSCHLPFLSSVLQKAFYLPLRRKSVPAICMSLECFLRM